MRVAETPFTGPTSVRMFLRRAWSTAVDLPESLSPSTMYHGNTYRGLPNLRRREFLSVSMASIHLSCNSFILWRLCSGASFIWASSCSIIRWTNWRSLVRRKYLWIKKAAITKPTIPPTIAAAAHHGQPWCCVIHMAPAVRPLSKAITKRSLSTVYINLAMCTYSYWAAGNLWKFQHVVEDAPVCEKNYCCNQTR